jgi:hypothetical protein
MLEPFPFIFPSGKARADENVERVGGFFCNVYQQASTWMNALSIYIPRRSFSPSP